MKRTLAFSLKGGGTKMIPIARPRIVVDGNKACFVFRDAERGSKVSMAYTDDLRKGGMEGERPDRLFGRSVGAQSGYGTLEATETPASFRPDRLPRGRREDCREGAYAGVCAGSGYGEEMMQHRKNGCFSPCLCVSVFHKKRMRLRGATHTVA